MTLNVAELRSHFPSLSSGIAHFDGTGGTQTPVQVINAVSSAMSSPLSNRGVALEPELNAENLVEAFRRSIADLTGGDPAGVVYGRSATQLSYDFSHHLAKTWLPGDEIVVSRLDHDSNIRPWMQAAEPAGVAVRWVDFDPATGELSLESLRNALGERTRLVAITGASNLLGTRTPLLEIAALVHRTPALFYVDGVHLTAHAPIDVKEIGADFFVCSLYKILGPHSGALVADPALLETLQPDKLLPSSNSVPERFEYGTLPYETMAGISASVDFIAHYGSPSSTSRRERVLSGMAAFERHEDQLREHLEAGLAAIPGIEVHSRAACRTPTLLLTMDGRKPTDAYGFLAQRGILAPAGSFYAHEAVTRMGIGPEGGLRLGLAPYNNTSDIERVLDGLAEFMAT